MQPSMKKRMGSEPTAVRKNGVRRGVSIFYLKFPLKGPKCIAHPWHFILLNFLMYYVHKKVLTYKFLLTVMITLIKDKSKK